MKNTQIHYFNDVNELNKSYSLESGILRYNDIEFSQVILPVNEGKISIVGKYIQVDKSNCIKIANSSNNSIEVTSLTEDDEYYYGVSPKIDINDDLAALYNGLLEKDDIEQKGLLIDNYVKTNGNCFCLPDTEYNRSVLPVLARYITLCILNKYERLLNDKNKKIFKNNIDKDNKNETVFYSGSFMNVVSINGDIHLNGNKEISPLEISFVRSSYGMAYAFDANLASNDETKDNLFRDCFPEILANKYSELINELFKDHDKVFKDMMKNIRNVHMNEQSNEQTRRDIITHVNDYLKKSFFINQVGVSSSVITSDGYFLLGERPKIEYDSEKIYPAVNGNAETIDGNVGFYRYSIEEDFPTINLSRNRIDYHDEISREAHDELLISFNDAERSYYGLNISGFSCNASNKRRCNFNILFENKTQYTFDEINAKSKRSTESFEIKQIYGLKLPYEDKGISIIKKALKYIKDNLPHVAAITFAFTSLMNKQKTTEVSSNDSIDFIMILKNLIIDVINIIFNIITGIFNALYTLVVSITNGNFLATLWNYITAIFSNDSINNVLNDIAVILAIFYISELIISIFKRSYLRSSLIFTISRNMALKRTLKKFLSLSWFRSLPLRIKGLFTSLNNKKKKDNAEDNNNVKVIKDTNKWRFNKKAKLVKKFHPVTVSILSCYLIKRYWSLHNKEIKKM